MKTLIIIPACMESRHLPGKPLLEIVDGKTLLDMTRDAAQAASAEMSDDGYFKTDAVVIATSDSEIDAYCHNRGMWRMFTSDQPTGTHRCAAVAALLSNQRLDVVINWQADEPLVPPDAILKLVDAIKLGADIATLVAPIDIDQARDPHIVKTIVLGRGDTAKCQWFSHVPMGGAFGHCGVYAFRTYRGDVLKRLAKLDPTPLSRFEGLEQLAWIEAGHRIVAIPMAELPPAVNVEADLEIVRERYEAAREGADQNDFADARPADSRR